MKTKVFPLLLLGAVLMLLAAAPVALKYPDGWIPLFSSQSSDHVSTVLNTEQITRITPILDLHNHAEPYLEVQFSNGEKLQVFEPFEEFMERIRRSQ